MNSPTRILHILSQRPSLTGSGIYLDAMVRLAQEAGFKQSAVVGIPAGDREISLGGLSPHFIHPVYFRAEAGSPPPLSAPPCDLNFPIPGMSDVMPYSSTVWAEMSQDQLQQYREVWSRHLRRVIDQFQPHLIHSNHLWLVTSLLKDLAGSIPVMATCHATGLRQMTLCADLAAEIQAGCSQVDHFCVLHQEHQDRIIESMDVQPHKITVTGIGFRDEIFNAGVMDTNNPNRCRNLLYVGKYSHAKGLPWLLDAFELLLEKQPRLHLHIAGSGTGAEADHLRRRMEKMGPSITMHGMLNQVSLAQLMGRCAITVLPSFYEGVPLVLAEAAACGCRVVSTALPGVTEQLAPILGQTLHLVPLPRLVRVDKPEPDDLPGFVQNLASVLLSATEDQPAPPCNLDQLTWRNVYNRIATIWAQYV